jgi:hypothetical protein
MAHSASNPSMNLQVHDTEGMPTMCSSVLTKKQRRAPDDHRQCSRETRQYELTQLQKSRNGKTLAFKSSGATVTLTIEEAHTPPRLHLVARVFVPVVDSTYTISQAEQERLGAWINTLSVGVLS